MRIVRSTDRRAMARLFSRDTPAARRVVTQAGRIVADVRRGGDRALAAWMARLDGVRPPFRVPAPAVDAGWARTPPGVRAAIRSAAKAIRRVAEEQLPRPFRIETEKGVRIEQRTTPFARVGCYVPGGRYPLTSTLLMTAIPAAVAGVRDITVACPNPTATVLAAAREAGVTRVIRIGGAQAIAALAFGTETICRVDKIVGPGNAWVAAAKSLVASACSIDLPAGPSEIVICTDDGEADWIASDLVAQAEHDPDARAVLVTTSAPCAAAVAGAVRARIRAGSPAATSLKRHGVAVVVRSRTEAVDLVNRLAPEHVVCDAPYDASSFSTAGTIFVGRWSAQAAGDYVTGSNHVLPTGGAARWRGGLSAADFVRTFTVQTVTASGLRAIGPAAITLAAAEGLEAHAASIRIRLRASKSRTFRVRR
jgi:histidinol dehydrogenase